MQSRVDNPVETMVDLFAKKFGRITEVHATGSMFELPLKYVIQNISDADAMIVPTTVEAVEEECESVEICMKHLIIDGSETETGFVKLISKYKGETRFLFIKESDLFVNSGPVRKIIFTTDDENFDNVFNCFEFTKSFTLDSVTSIKCLKWPSIANEWRSRKRPSGRPSKDVIERVVKQGCHFVPQPELGMLLWRYSFSLAELILIHSWTATQKFIYHILRLIKKDMLEQLHKPDGRTTRILTRSHDRVFSSYSLKTILLWKCEEINSDQFWEEENLASSINVLILYFVELLIDRTCPHYFILNCNIWAHVESSLSFDREIQYLTSLVENNAVEKYLITYSIVKKSEFRPKDLSLKVHERLYNYCGFIAQANIAGVNQILPFRKFARLSNDLRTLCQGLHLQRQYFITPKCELKTINDKILECFQTPEYKFIYQSNESHLQIINSMLHLSLPNIFRALCKYYTSDDFIPPCEFEDSYVATCARPYQSMMRKTSLTAFKSFRSCLTDAERWMNVFIDTSLVMQPPVFHFVTTAYRANYLYVSAKDYSGAVTVCEDALLRLFQLINPRLKTDFPIVLTNEWVEIYDERIQAIFGFSMLWNTKFYQRKRKVRKSCKSIVLHMLPECFFHYILMSARKAMSEEPGSIHSSELWRYLVSNVFDNNCLDFYARYFCNFLCFHPKKK